MSAPPFKLSYTPSALAVLTDLAGSARHRVKAKKIAKTLRILEKIGPSYPGLHSHQYVSVKGPGGQPLWESYVENNTPGAWRIWWICGPEPAGLTIITVGPHP